MNFGEIIEFQGRIVGISYSDEGKEYTVELNNGETINVPEKDIVKSIHYEIVDAWNTARKIAIPDSLESYTKYEIEEIFGEECDRLSILNNYTYNEVLEKIVAWKKKKEEINVWDVVNYDGENVIVTEIDFTGKATITRKNGSVTHINKRFLRPIGTNLTGIIKNGLDGKGKLNDFVLEGVWDSYGLGWKECSRCKCRRQEIYAKESKYCPECGAKMRIEEPN